MSLLKRVRFILVFFVLVMCFPDVCKASNTKSSKQYYNKPINLLVNDVKLTDLPMSPVFYKDYLLVPSREVFAPLGAYIEYKDREKRVYIIYDEKLMTLQVDNLTATIGEQKVKLTVPPKIVNNKLLIPLRSVSESIGLLVEWDGKNNSAYVYEQIFKETKNQISLPNISLEENNNLENIISQPVEITTNTIQNVEIPQRGETKFAIEFSAPIGDYTESRLQDNRLVLDFYNAFYNVPNVYYNIDSEYVKNIRLGTENTYEGQRTRVVFDLLTSDNYSITLSEDKKIIYIDFSIQEQQEPNEEVVIPPPSENNINNEISYKNGILTISKNNNPINLSDIEEIDDYTNNKYILAFPENFQINYSDSKIDVYDSKVNYFLFANNKLIIYESQLLVPEISEDEQNIYIKMMFPKEKYDKIVILDPGHGGEDAGASRNGINEKDINLDIAKKVVKIIENDESIKCYMTRTEDIYINRPDRIKFSNNLGDIFISIHTNANPNSKPKGIETYYYNNEIVNRLGFTSKRFADIVQNNIIRATNGVNREVKTEPFDVIKFATIPAVLMEVGFISNPEEFNLLTSDSYKQKIAESIYNSISDTFSIYRPAR